MYFLRNGNAFPIYTGSVMLCESGKGEPKFGVPSEFQATSWTIV